MKAHHCSNVRFCEQPQVCASPQVWVQVTTCVACSYGGFCEQPNFAQPQAEDEDAFARRIWQEMERRKRQQTDGAAAACDLFAAEREAAMAREQASFDAAQRSRRILEEEKAKDRAWREAVQKVSELVGKNNGSCPLACCNM